MIKLGGIAKIIRAGLAFAVALVGCASLSYAANSPQKMTANEVNRLIERGKQRGFSIEGEIVGALTNSWPFLSLRDDTGSVILQRTELTTGDVVVPGDRVLISGNINKSFGGRSMALIQRQRVITHGPQRAPEKATFAAVKSGAVDAHWVRVEGVVSDAFFDEIYPACRFIALFDGEETLFINYIADSQDDQRENSLAPIGARIAVTGIAGYFDDGLRTNIGRTVRIDGSEAIELLSGPPDDIFSLSGRVTITGEVVAVWSPDNVLLKGERGFTRAELTSDQLPAIADIIEVSGFPETDFYRLNLSRAFWRKQKAAGESGVVGSSRPTLEAKVIKQFDVYDYGRYVKLENAVIAGEMNERVISVDWRGEKVRVYLPKDFSAPSGFGEGARLEVSGIQIAKVFNWSANGVFPHIEGYFLVPRSSEDIVIIARAPWWTPLRFLMVIAILMLFIVVVLLWNVILKRVVDRRSRELASERLGHEATLIRSTERTRLAIDLHDGVAQMLSGVSLQLDAALSNIHDDVSKAVNRLKFANTTLQACRSELRNSIWDLRNLAWEERDFASAIRKTVASYIGEAKLVIRFNAPREILEDAQSCAILNILRELVSNASRHGRAQVIKIAGTLEDGHILFSIIDDGVGFDPDSAPGMAQGHFGLSGIRERVRRLEGSLEIESAPGKGTKVKVRI